MTYPGRALLVVVLFWAIVFGAFIGARHARADHTVCPTLELPVRVAIYDPYPTPWRSWTNYINAKAGKPVFVEDKTSPTAYIFPLEWLYGNPAFPWLVPNSTQVIMSCTLPTPMILVSSSTDNWIWAGHELMHLLGYGDHVYWYYIYGDTTGRHWIKPKVCDVLASPLYSSYFGVMSYCTPKNWWFKTTNDIQMLRGLK